jgi:aerobic carbon-monoxide dehydrogenase medium subunit
VDPFSYFRANSIVAARAHFEAASDARYLAGGQTLLPIMKQRLASPSVVIALAGIKELRGIERERATISIGAMTRHADVAGSEEIRRTLPALAVLAGAIGDPHVRNRGTIGGSLANSDPAADYPAAVLGLGATIHTDRRTIAAGEFFVGLFTTVLEPGELITRVAFPIPEIAGYAKFPNPASRYAVVGVMVSRGVEGVRVAVAGAGSHVFRVAEMEAALARSFTSDAVSAIKHPADGLNRDRYASAAYRAHLITVMTKRSVAAALTGSKR